MPPNTVETPDLPGTGITDIKENEESLQERFSKSESGFQFCQSILVLIANVLAGIILGVCLIFAYRNGLPLGATNLHIVLCVIGYQLLMAQAILSLTSSQGWHSKLTLIQKKRAHWILQIVGSGLAIAGSFFKIIDKQMHWTSLHGKFGLVAMVFTTVSLVNGLTSLYAYELSRFIPSILSKITHICFGTIAFMAASLCLCYGINKSFFRSWANSDVTDVLVAITAIFTTIIIINPLITFYVQSKSIIKKNLR